MNRKTIRVLLIENDVVGTRLPTDLLSESDNSLFVVERIDRLSSARDALSGKDFDAIVLDLNLPDSKGINTLKRLVAIAPNIPMIVCSASEEESVALSVLKEGAQDYLVKGNITGLTLVRSVLYAIQRAATFVSPGKRVAKKEVEKPGGQAKSRDITERKLTDEALLRAAREWRATFDSITDLILIQDADCRITRVNRALADFLKMSPKDLIGRLCHEVIHGTSEPPPFCPLKEVFETGKSVEAEIFEPHLGIFVHLVASPIKDAKGDVVASVHVMKDITERKRAEEALKESEEKYRSLVENINEVVFNIDLNGTIQYISPVAQAITGFSVDEYREKNLAEFIHPEDLPQALSGFKRSLEGIKGETEFRTITKDGSYRHMRSSSNPSVEAGSVIGLTGVITDITERKAAEQALEKERRDMLLILDSSPIIIFHKDREGRFIRVNKTFAESLEMPGEEITGKTVFDLYSSEIARGMTVDDREVIESGRPKLNIVEYYESAGGIRWVRTDKIPIYGKDNDVIGLVGFAQDITERRRIEEALKKEQQDILLILDSSPVIIFYTDKEGRFIRVNKRFAMGLGRTEEEIIGKTVYDLFSPEVAQSMTDDDQEVIQSGRPKLNIIEHFESPLGPGWIQTDKVPIYGENSSVIGVAGFAQDITDREETEEALRESEERFKQVAESAGEWIWEVDADGLYIYSSPIVEKILGYRPEEIVGKKYFYDFFHPEDRETFKAAALAAFADKQPFREFTNRNVHKNGQTVWLSTSGFPLLDNLGNLHGYRGADTDITERKTAENNMREANKLLLERTVELRQSEEKYRSLVEHINEVVFNLDSKGKITYISPVAESITGYSTDEYLENNFTEFVHPEDIPRLISSFRLSLKGIKEETEFRTLTKDGSYLYVRSSSNPTVETGTVVGFTGLITNITERKQAEEALRESEEKFRSLFRTSRDFLSISSLEGEVIDANEAAREFFGYSSEEFCRTRMQDLYADPEARQRLIDLMLVSGYVQNKEIRMKKKDGEIVDALVTINLIRDNHGNPIGFFGSARDVTEKKKMELQLLQTEKLSAVGTMISGVAHELNNPLTSIIGNAQLLARRDVPDDIKNKLNVILKESRRSSKIVGGLLAFAREHKPERKMIDINDVVMESLRLREYDLKVSNIDVQLALSDDLPETLSDPFQLQQVFINLINNARDALAGQEKGALAIRTYRKDDTIQIEFEDNGPGIPDEFIKKVFDPFFTTKEVGEGTGLGLSMAYGIVREHGGAISVESRPGKGAKFVVMLPITKGAESTEEKVKAPVKQSPGARSVLVVEDEASLRDLISEVLIEAGFFVETASTGDEAIHLLDTRAYDAVVSDIKMPGIGGRELYLYTQKHYPETAQKIIFITGDVLSKDTQSFLKITDNRFIEKPFDVDILVAMINDMLSE